MDAETTCGTLLSMVTVLVTLEDFPAASVAVTSMVFAPSDSVTLLLNELSEPTVTLPWSLPFSLMVMLTGLLVASLVLPETFRVEVAVIRPSAGE